MIAPHGMTLGELENLSPQAAVYQHVTTMETFRLQAVKQAAEQVGLQGGLAAESQQINQVLEQNASQLDQIFNFNLVLYQHAILPPVIVQAKDKVNVSDNGQTIRIGGQNYQIIKQVQFVSTPPTWRDYLWMSYQPPKLPNHVLLPRNDQERTLWQQTVSKAWQQGEAQAVAIFKVNLNRLLRDFTGMVLYKELLEENMVSPFFTTTQQQGVVGDGSNMTIDSQLMHINTQPQLQLHTKFWKPSLVSPLQEPS